MRTRSILERLLVALVLAAPLASHGQLFRAYLSGSGSDANACTLAAPCRLLPAALTAVADGGEVWMLDSANYNTAEVAVSKSVTILAVPGVVGSLVGNNNAVMTVSAPGAKVTLRNLVMKPQQGAPASLLGIQVSAAASVTLEGSLLSGFGGAGIVVTSATVLNILDTTVRNGGTTAISLANGAQATIVDSHIVDNAGTGIVAFGAPALAPTTVQVSRCTISGNQIGVNGITGQPGDKVTVVVAGSTISRHTGAGLQAQATGGGTVTLTATGNLIAANVNQGIIAASTGARVYASGNTIVGHPVGLAGTGGGTAETYSDNRLRDNDIPSSGTVNINTKS